jgi:hypothetical protein
MTPIVQAMPAIAWHRWEIHPPSQIFAKTNYDAIFRCAGGVNIDKAGG